MRLCHVDDLVPGMFLADPVYLEDGRLLAAAGTQIGDTGIAVLREQRLVNVAVHEDGTDDIEIPEIIHDEMRRDAFTRVRQTIAFLRSRLAMYVDLPPNRILAELRSPELQRRFAKVNIYNELEGLADDLVVAMTNQERLDGFSFSRRANELQVDHAIDVTAISLGLASRVAMSQQRRRELVLGALMHDIGMIFVSPQILSKEGALTVSEWRGSWRTPHLATTSCRSAPAPSGSSATTSPSSITSARTARAIRGGSMAPIASTARRLSSSTRSASS